MRPALIKIDVRYRHETASKRKGARAGLIAQPLRDRAISKPVETFRRDPLRRYTKEEPRALGDRFRRWSTPDEFGSLIQKVGRETGFYAVSQGGLKIWREAWVAMSCARLTHAHSVRLGADPPDFELSYGDHRRSFEIVDLWPADSRIGATYDHYAKSWNAGEGVPIRHADMEGEINALPDDLREQLRRKMVKGYPPETILVVDIHHSIFPGTDYMVEQDLARIGRQALEVFAEIWLRMGIHILRITQSFETRISPIKPFEDE